MLGRRIIGMRPLGREKEGLRRTSIIIKMGNNWTKASRHDKVNRNEDENI